MRHTVGRPIRDAARKGMLRYYATKRGTVVAVTALAVFGVVGHLPADAGPAAQVPTHTGCLVITGSNAGKIVAVAGGQQPRRACTGEESKIALSSGDITSVAAGIGLRAPGDSLGLVDKQGAAKLELAPVYRLPQGCTVGQQVTRTASGWGCANPVVPPSAPTNMAIVGSDGGPGIIGDDWANIGGKLDIPAGQWTITAKTGINSGDPGNADIVTATCRLDAGGSTFLDDTWMYSSDAWDATELTLMAAISRDTPFTAAIACKDAGAGADWHSVRITAIQAGTVKNVNF